MHIVRNVTEVATDPKCWNKLRQDSAFFQTWIRNRCQNFWKTGPRSGIIFYFRR